MLGIGMELNEFGGLVARAARHAKAAKKPSRFSAKQKVAAFIAGAIVIIGGGSGGFVIIHGGGGGSNPCTTSDASGCVNSTVGTFLTYNNPTHFDSSKFLINCTKNWLTYATSASAVGNHQDAVVSAGSTGFTWPVHVNITFTGGLNPDMVQIKEGSGCVGKGDSVNTSMNAASAGATAITLASNPGTIVAGTPLQIDAVNSTREFTTVQSVTGTAVTLADPLLNSHGAGTTVRAVIGIDLVTHMVEGGAAGGGGDDGEKADTSAGCGTGGQEGLDPTRSGVGCPGINQAGDINCGPLVGSNHQDAWQPLGGENLVMIDLRSGNFGAGVATCVGDGAGFFIAGAAPSGGGAGCDPLTAIGCQSWGWGVNNAGLRVNMVTCIHGLDAHMNGVTGTVNWQNSTGYVRSSHFRSGLCGVNVGAIGASVYNYDAGIVKMAGSTAQDAAPGWRIGRSSTTAVDIFGDTYCPAVSLPNCPWTPFNPAYNGV